MYSENPQLEAVAPPCAVQVPARVIENVEIAERTYRLRLDAPAIAGSIQPGQFVMVRAPSTLDPLLGRPFALSEVVRSSLGKPRAFSVSYLTPGRGTTDRALRRRGHGVSTCGPRGT